MRKPAVIIDAEVPYSGDAIQASDLFQGWLKGLDPTWDIRKIRIRYANHWKDAFRMIYLEAEIYPESVDGKTQNAFPGIVFLRGNTVDILTIVSDGKEEYAVLVEQSRVPVGGVVTSNPSGMTDGSSNLQAVALSELAEEVGDAQWADPICLNPYLIGSDTPLLVTPGGSDEAVVFYAVRVTMSTQELDALQGRHAGNAGEHEQTIVRLLPLNEVPEYLESTGRPDLKTLMGWLMYRYYLSL